MFIESIKIIQKMDIKSFLDSTYLKTEQQAGLSELENKKLVINCINEAITERFKLVMIRPNYVVTAKQLIVAANSILDIGTVISFPEGTHSVLEKLNEAQVAINNGADDLDFVINYQAFKKGQTDLVKKEVLHCTQLGIDNNKVVKWIIETAALNNDEIIKICVLIKNVIMSNFKEQSYPFIFIKSSTGFYKTENNMPNGATVETIVLMLENGSPLAIKASGGIKSYNEAVAMIRLGVKRIGTSAAKALSDGDTQEVVY